ncbi:hypothetical protein ABFP37_21950 [Burkholderia sp. RS01]|uniref:hypothetical protein n=1 Tax=unclassified Burkholderia TaxID=2613784 RepID=UPI0032185B3D
MPHELALKHRYSQKAFGFVVEGEGVWTIIGDLARMTSRDFLLAVRCWNSEAEVIPIQVAVTRATPTRPAANMPLPYST